MKLMTLKEDPFIILWWTHVFKWTKHFIYALQSIILQQHYPIHSYKSNELEW